MSPHQRGHRNEITASPAGPQAAPQVEMQPQRMNPAGMRAGCLSSLLSHVTTHQPHSGGWKEMQPCLAPAPAGWEPTGAPWLLSRVPAPV